MSPNSSSNFGVLRKFLAHLLACIGLFFVADAFKTIKNLKNSSKLQKTEKVFLTFSEKKQSKFEKWFAIYFRLRQAIFLFTWSNWYLIDPSLPPVHTYGCIHLKDWIAVKNVMKTLHKLELIYLIWVKVISTTKVIVAWRVLMKWLEKFLNKEGPQKKGTPI